MTTRVFLLDDHELVRRGLADLLEAQDDFEVVGEASSAAEAVSLIPQANPDVAVLDVRLPDGTGVEVCRELLSNQPDLACLMLTSYDDKQAVLGAALAGARGYLLKDIKGNDFVDVIRRIANGERLLDAERAKAAVEAVKSKPIDDPLATLSAQERRLLEHIAEGLTNRQIAAEMCLAEKTIKNYVSNLLMKLGMGRRTEAAVFAARLEERKRLSGE